MLFTCSIAKNVSFCRWWGHRVFWVLLKLENSKAYGVEKDSRFAYSYNFKSVAQEKFHTIFVLKVMLFSN